MSSRPRKPKEKCCVSSSRCKRCPIRMLRQGTLPEGYAVKKRRLVLTSVVASSVKTSKKKQGKKGKGKKVQPIAA